MGYIKETSDIIKESLQGISNIKKFKKIVDNMSYAIKTNTVCVYFPHKFRTLEIISLSINLYSKKLKEYLIKYKVVKTYYKTHFNHISFFLVKMARE